MGIIAQCCVEIILKETEITISNQKTNNPLYMKTNLIIFFFVLYSERDIGQNVTQARLKSSFREIFCFIQANPRSSCGFVWLRPGETRALQ